MAKIIAYQGQRAPIIVSKRSGFITKGHGRLEAIKRLGWEKAAVDFQDYENEAQEFADMVADNKIQEFSSLDLIKIREDALDLDFLNIEFDTILMGFPDLDLSLNFKIQEVNHGDENSEWVGLPEFNQADKEIKLIVIFKTEEERKTFCDEKEIIVTNVNNNQWTSRLNPNEPESN